MSLTSYRAAPPRDKLLCAFSKTETAESTPEGAVSVQRLPEKATLGLEGLEVAVCTNDRLFWKGPGGHF